MGREVRKVPPGWRHPKNEDGHYIPLLPDYAGAESDYRADPDDWNKPPNPDDFMPSWPDAEATHLMMYEDSTEGTPISPAFATAEELARWLADNKASAFESQTASYDAWLAMIRRGSCPTAVIGGWQIISGVEACSVEAQS